MQRSQEELDIEGETQKKSVEEPWTMERLIRQGQEQHRQAMERMADIATRVTALEQRSPGSSRRSSPRLPEPPERAEGPRGALPLDVGKERADPPPKPLAKPTRIPPLQMVGPAPATPAYEPKMLPDPGFTEYLKEGGVRKMSDREDEDSAHSEYVGAREERRRRSPSPSPAPSDGPPSSDPSITTSSRKKTKKGIVDASGRRTSMIADRVARSTDTSSIIQTYQPQASYDHIKLHVCDVPSVSKFFDQFNDYQSTFKIKLPTAHLIADSIRWRIVAQAENRLNMDKFFQLDAKEIFKLIQKLLRPRSKIQFYEDMDKHLSFTFSSRLCPSALKYKRFYEALLLYSHTFTNIYELLAIDNEVNIPAVNNKPFGLLKLFVDKIPFSYGHRVLSLLPSNRYDNVYEFQKDFMSVVSSHNEVTAKAQSMQECFGGSDYAALQKSTAYGPTAPDGSNSRDPQTTARNAWAMRNGQSSGHQSFPREQRQGSARFPHKVQMVSSHQPFNNGNGDYSDDSEGYHQTSQPPEVQHQYDSEDGMFNNAIPSHPSGPSELEDGFDLNHQQLEEASVLNALAAMEVRGGRVLSRASGKPVDVPAVCFNMLFHNKCPLPKCRFSHIASELHTAHAYYTLKLLHSIYGGAPKGAASLSHILANMSSMQYDTSFQQQCYECNDPAPTDHGPPPKATADCDKDLLELGQRMFCHFVPEASLLPSVCREGRVVLGDAHAKHIDIPRVLFDSGATSASYISAKFVDAHQRALAQFKVPCTPMSVTLADNKTVCIIDSALILPLLFVDGEGASHSAHVTCYVLPTLSTDMIVGWPDICAFFVDFFISIIRQGAYDIMKSRRFKQLDNNEETSCDDPICSVTEGIVETLLPPPVLLSREEVTSAIMSDAPRDPTLVDPSTGQQPWLQAATEEAPEDRDTDMPCSFTAYLNFMETSHEEAYAKFVSQIETQVAEAFLQYKNGIVRDLLLTKGAPVFCPTEWGITGTEPVELEFKDTLPDQGMKPPARPVSPKLLGLAKDEFDRLCKYLLERSSSPYASPVVIAPKSTWPFLRFCGDFRGINKHIAIGHYPIPNVQQQLAKIMGYSMFIDLDLANAFHQIRLGPITSARLSLQTIWGQYQPKFLPEGVGPASGILQRIVSEIFADFEEWTIVIYDNLLVLAHDMEDAYVKLDKILDRCIERNVSLKFAKSWIGFTEARFFGYIVKKGSYCLSAERKQAIMDIPFPDSLKKVQRFLGSALFFKSFMPHYSTLTAPLNDMVHTTFNWNRATWKVDYPLIFEQFKEALQKACELFYPNHDLPWVLRTDASNYGVGAVLLQLCPNEDGSKIIAQPICFISAKFSEQAQKWSTYEQECYAIYLAVKSFAHYLYGKAFVLETDHNNLLWMEVSAVPKVIRWRVYLQSFSFQLRHISGKSNSVADWLSRVYVPEQPLRAQSQLITVPHGDDLPSVATLAALSPVVIADTILPHSVQVSDPPLTPEQLISRVHNGRTGHFGARRTWLLLNEFCPGHKCSFQAVQDYVATCAICVKDRIGMTDNLQPLVRHLKPPHPRAMVGIDTLTITPKDEYGNEYLAVIVNHFMKFVALYPVPDHTAKSAATALFQYMCTYGLVDSIISDPGSEFYNEIVKHLTAWLGVNHVFSLVDRHESNGVEGSNKQILRHLKALVFEERLVNRWSSPTVLPLIQFIMNSSWSSETGQVPFTAMFGSSDATYFHLPEGGSAASNLNAYIQLLDDNLCIVREASRKFQEGLIAERSSAAVTPATQNVFQLGDFILFQQDPSKPLPSKLSPKFMGPYEVLHQVKNDITCKHLVQGSISVFHVTRVKLFPGSREQAFNVALLDYNQHVIDTILAYRGDPMTRTTMEFQVLFKDGSLVWLPYTRDLSDAVQFEAYCRSLPELMPLIYTVAVAKTRIQKINRTPIKAVAPGDVCFFDLRSYGATWYAGLQLPDPDHHLYLLSYKYIKFLNKQSTRIQVYCAIFDESFALDHFTVLAYGTRLSLDNMPPDSYTLIDEQFCVAHPTVLPDHSRASLLKIFRQRIKRL